MDRSELESRLWRLGYITQEQQAEALGTAQYNVSRYLSGARPVPRHVARMLELIEAHPPVVLSYAMRRCLEGASAAGDRVRVPRSQELALVSVSWGEVMAALVRMGVTDERNRLTERGAAALKGA